MKRVLFVIETLGLGGPTTSLAAMLDLLRRSGCEPDLFVMDHAAVPAALTDAHLLPEDRALAASLCRKRDVRRRFGMIGTVRRILLSILKRIFPQDKIQRIVYRRAAARLCSYDTVAAYQEGHATEFAGHIAAAHRIAWVHTIYDRFTADTAPKSVLRTYEKFESIVCVAAAGADAFRAAQPTLAPRVAVIPNPINCDRIRRMAKDAPQIQTAGRTVIASVGRLSPEKQYSYALEAAARLMHDGIDFAWYIVGDGEDAEALHATAEKLGLCDRVIFTGALDNPYPIIAAAAMLVISSAYEAQPMVANEALTLGVPVVTTDYAAAGAVTGGGRFGVVCENSPDGLYTAVKRFLTDADALADLRRRASRFEYDNGTVVREVRRLICNDDGGNDGT